MQENTAISLACFDFDGTITCKDTLIDFLLRAFGPFRVGMGRSLKYLLGYAAGFVPNDIAKEHLIHGFLHDMPYEHFQRISKDYSLSRIDEIHHPRASRAIREHQEAGHEIAVVSASIEEWIRPWCESQQIRHVLATCLEQKDNVLTGRFSTRNCNGPEKVRRIRRAFDLKKYDTIYAYGDSSGNREMLAMADVKYYRWRKL